MWAAPEIAPCRGWRLCDVVCEAHDLWRRVPSFCRCGVALCDDFNTSYSYFFLMSSCTLHAQQIWTSKPLCCRHLSLPSLCETWWINFSCSTWSLHLWFRKPRTEAKDSLCGLGGNVDLCVDQGTHTSNDSLLPHHSQPYPSFLPLTRTHPLDYHVLLNALFFSSPLSAPHSPVLFT